MIKIKDNVDLRELEKFGFYLEGNTYKYNLPLHKCDYICIISKKRELVFPCYNLRWYQFIFKNKIIKEIAKIQSDLTQARISRKGVGYENNNEERRTRN